jgi:hypothetical protein
LVAGLRDAPIAAAQLGAISFAVADFAWVARPSEIGWPSFARGLLLAVAAGATIGFVAGIIAAAISRAIGRPSIGAGVAAPFAAAVWMACFAASLLFVAFRFADPTLAAWAVALASLAAIPVALVFALAIARALAPLSRRVDPRSDRWAGFWAALVIAGLGAITALWIRPLGLGCFALAVGLLASRARPVRLRITAIAAVAGAAIAVSPLCDDRAAWEARRGSTLMPAIEAALAPLADRDGDGRLALFGSGDCDEGDAAIGPTAVERAGNGVDEDCRFGDLIDRPAAGPRRRRVDAVLLLSIAALDSDGDGALRPALPALQRAIDGGARFTGGRGVAGRFADVAPLLIDGALPLEIDGDHGGFDLGAPSIPLLVEAAGGSAALSRPKSIGPELNTAFNPRRVYRKSDEPAAIASKHRAALGAKPGFLWIHLDARRRREKLDRAAAAAIARAREAGAAVLVVGLPDRGAAHEIGGGPIALLGAGQAPRIEAAPVGHHDVYPTLADLLGLPAPATAGRSLLGELDGPAFFGEVGGAAAIALGAFDATAWVLHRPRSFGFDSSVGRFAERDAGPGPVAGLATALRRELLGPRLAALNRRRDARVAALPDDLLGSPSRIAGALTIHGCAIEHRPGGAIIEVYYQGVGLRRGDLFAVKVYAPGATSIRGVIHPDVPLAELERGALYRHRLDLDTRRLGDGSAFVWFGVSRAGDRLPVTSGSGSTPEWALVCRLDPPGGA